MSTSFTPEPFDFGQLLVKNGLVSETALLECLEVQRDVERSGHENVPRLGEVLVARGYLTQNQVLAVLTKQEKAVLYCPRCEIQVNVQRRPDVREVKCVRCEGTLEELTTLRDVRVTDDSLIFISKEPVPREVEEASKDMSRKFGKYTLINEIGRGAVGVVHRAWDHYLNQWVALKRIKPQSSSTPSELGRVWHETRVISLLKEARSAVRLRHPHIVTIYDVGKIAKEFYISMEYLEGATLGDHFKKARVEEKTSPFYEEPRKYISVFRDVARALHYAHTRPSPVIHCDLKPSNIFIDREGSGFILDFGLAKDLRAADEDPAGTIRGTPSYMAPEQASGHSEDIDARTDVYGVGAMLYELIAGRAPFNGDLMTVLRKVVSEYAPRPTETVEAIGLQKVAPRHRTLLTALERVCLKAMEKEKSERYQTAKELAIALDAVLKTDTNSHKTPEPMRVTAAAESQDFVMESQHAVLPPHESTRRWWVVGILALVLGGLIGVGSAMMVSSKSKKPVTLASLPAQVDDSVRRFRPDTAKAFCQAEQGRTTDATATRQIENFLVDLEWMERLRLRLIESLNLSRPTLPELKLREQTLANIEVLKATREGLVVIAGDKSSTIAWDAVRPEQVTALVRTALGTLTVADRFGLALYACRTDQGAVGLELLESLSGTDLEIPAAKEISRLGSGR